MSKPRGQRQPSRILRAILAPAIAIMDRMSFGKKFGLISILFFIPLTFQGYTLVSASFSEITKAKREAEGIELLTQMLSLHRTLSEYRNLSAPTHTFNREDLVLRAGQVESAWKDKLTQLQSNELFVELGEERYSTWESKVAQIKSTIQPTVIDQYRAYNAIVQDHRFLIDEISSEIGLSADPDPNVQAMARLMISIADIYENVGYGYSVGTYGLFETFIQSATYDSLNDVYDILLDGEAKFTETYDSLVSVYGNEMSPGLKDELAMVKAHLEEIRFKMDDEIIGADSISLDWKDYTAFINSKLDVVDQSILKLGPELSRILDGRIGSLYLKATFFISLIFTVVAVIWYFYLALYMSLRHTIHRFLSTARNISNGDMRERISINAQDELGELAKEFNRMVEKMHILISDVSNVAMSVLGQSASVRLISNTTSEAAQQQMEQTELVATAVTEMASISDTVADQSRHGTENATAAQTEANGASRTVDQTLTQISELATEIQQSSEVIDKLAQSSDSVSSMLEVIKNIADQTNLLALNAAIEAARAGEQGRGFAVVADEVRTLAQRTQSSATEIEETITQLQEGVKTAVTTMERSHEKAFKTVESSKEVSGALGNIINSIDIIVEANQQIEHSSNEQMRVSHEIDQNVVSISEQGKQSVGDSTKTVRAAQEMAELSKDLQKKLDQFKI